MILTDMKKGVRANLPVAASVIAYASVLGVLSAQKGITWVELLGMNCLMFAGSAQFVIVELWQDSLAVLEITMAVLVINLRYFLITASLQPLFAGHSLLHKAAGIHLVADENWVVIVLCNKEGQIQ